MKRNLTIIIFLLAVFSIMFFSGCQNPMNPVDLENPDVQQPTATATEASNADAADSISTGVTFTIPKYAPWIGSTPVSRAYGFTDSVEVTVYDSESAEIYNDTFTPEGSGSYISCEVTLTPGSGYIAEIDIYNHTMSTTVPVVSGSSAGFNIIEGEVTQVPVICTPNNPTLAEADTEYNFSGTATVIGGGGYPVSSGTEFWYMMTAPSSGYISIDIDVPQDIAFYYGAFNSAGEATYAFGEDVGGPGPETLNFSVTPSEDYYFGIVCADSSATTIEGSISWTEVIVVELSDSDVPDPSLRACIEDEVGGGKEFITETNPSPVSPVTDLDLSSLTYLDMYIEGNSEPVVLTNLTGLELCNNLTDLYFDYASISGCDLSEGGTSAAILEGMNSLNWLRLCYTDIDSFGFISGLSGLSGLYVRDNPYVDIYDFAVITPTNFPNLEYLYISGWDIDSDGDIDEDDAFTGEYWSDVMAVLRPFSGMGSIEIREFWEGDTEFARLFNAGEVLDTNSGNLGSLFISDNNLTDASMTYIAGLSGLSHLNMDNNPGITDISALTVLTNLEHLDISCTSVTDLSPLQTLYDAGAFHNHFDYDEIDITLNGCGLELWEGTDNRAVIDYLIAGGVRISYEYGNYLAVNQITWEDAFPNPNSDYIHGMTFDGTDLWMVGRGTDTIYRVSSIDGSVLQSFDAPTGVGDGTGLTYDGIYLWYTHDQSPRSIYQINPNDGAVLSLFSSPGSFDSTGLAWDGSFLWNTGFYENIYQLDIAGNIQKSFSAPTDVPEGMTYAGGYLWVIGWHSTLYKLDPADGSIVTTYSTPPTNMYGLTSDGTYLWLSTNDGWIKRYPISGL